MGMFTGLLTLPLAPVRGVAWIAEQVMEEMERELYDEDNIRREMLQLELDFEDGLIDNDERQVREDALLERLAISQAGDAPLADEETDDG
ncbi:MAG: gas vesicle protein GvpG [Solirubrobacterales bacterium]|nr:gas vesicle protein GvpG [Solirubrobacterales bacterium]